MSIIGTQCKHINYYIFQLGKGASDTNVVELSISDFQEQYNDECVYNDSTRVRLQRIYEYM